MYSADPLLHNRDELYKYIAWSVKPMLLAGTSNVRFTTAFKIIEHTLAFAIFYWD